MRTDARPKRNQREAMPANEDGALTRHDAQLTIAQACRRLDGLSVSELQQLRQFEARHRNRKGMIEALDRRIAQAARRTS